MSKEKIEPSAVLERVDSSRTELMQALHGLSDEDLLTPGMTGNWRGKDVLAHIARWEEVAVSAIQAHLRGESLAEDYNDYEAWNAKWAAEDEDLPLAQAQHRFETAHRELTDLLASLPAEKWDGLIVGWTRAVTWNHYSGHTASIMEWRSRQQA